MTIKEAPNNEYFITLQDQTHQSDTDQSYIGGIPRVPIAWEHPECSLCGGMQTFFFQIRFPVGVKWSGLTLAVYACIECADENWLIPEMIKEPLRGAGIPLEFPEKYQRNFKFVVFDSQESSLDEGYEPRVAFQGIEIHAKRSQRSIGKIGGIPDWLLEDEAPSLLSDGENLFFLLQLYQSLSFQRVNGAPPQIELGLDGTPYPSGLEHYELFLGNALYFFGTEIPDAKKIYLLTQVP